MKLILILALLIGGYYLFLAPTSDLMHRQVQGLRTTYTSVANNAEHLAGGR